MGVNWNKCIAGVFVGAGALLLIYEGYVKEGAILLGTMCGFFVGDTNGYVRAKNETS